MSCPKLRLLPAVLLLCAAAPAGATTYTVAPSGSNDNDGIRAPFRTLQWAASVVQDGDTLVFQPGLYRAGADIEARNITIRGIGDVVFDGTDSEDADGLVLDEASGATVENIKFVNCRRSGATAWLATGITFRDCEFSRNGSTGLLTANVSELRVERCAAMENGDHGIYLSQSGDRLKVVGCKLRLNGNAGIQVNAWEESPRPEDLTADGHSDDCIIEDNELYGNGGLGGAAINLAGVQRSSISNNLLYYNLAGGIALWDDGEGQYFSCRDNRVIHNTVLFESGFGFFGVQVLEGSTGNQVFNNVLVCGEGSALEATEVVQSDYNCLWAPTAVNEEPLAVWRQATGNDLHSIEADPLLTEETYRLSPGSPARDRGTLLLDRDKDGRPRPEGAGPDLGCYEEALDGNVPPPVEPLPIYLDAAAKGWKPKASKARYSMNASNPVFQGSRSIWVTITGRNGWFRLTGPGLETGTRTHLRLAVYGGAAGGQALTLRLLVGGRQQGAVNLSSYGSPPAPGTWTEYAIPLADLQAAGGTVTGLKIGAGGKQKKFWLDNIRIE